MTQLNRFYIILFLVIVTFSCNRSTISENENTESNVAVNNPYTVIIEAENFVDASGEFIMAKEGDISFIEASADNWMSFDVSFEMAGRYRSEVVISTSDNSGTVWIEDYIDNADGRTYNVTGNIEIKPGSEFKGYYVEGSPFNNSVVHKMKLHISQGILKIDKIVFTLMKDHQVTPITHTQKMGGEEWQLVWSDEFDGNEIDNTKWIYDIGNWGWGNNELQYYTENRKENARVEDGNLIIEARKNDMGEKWTSARLTTRGKHSFLYGKIELKAIVPREKGNWAAGWTLGDSYRDEISWPYCGEIDILESVGYEVDDETGNGIAHVTVHTPAYYFKINNQISSTKEVLDIAGKFHTYSVEWTPEEIRGYLDGEQYYVYEENANKKEWPFDEAQNIILNLAMGGGWGGAQGMDTTVTSQKFILDYVRVYQLK